MSTRDKRCINCNSPLNGPICHLCGQKLITAKWSMKILWVQFFNLITDIEKGFTHTIISLLKKPGVAIKEYWNGCTVPYYNPFRFALILIAINLLISYWLGINEMLAESMNDPASIENIDPDHFQKASNTFNQWLNVLVLLLIPIRSILTKLFFHRRGNNYAEHLIMNSFIVGQQAVFSSITQFIFFLLPGIFIIYIPFNFLIGLLYDSWVFRKTFKENILIIIIKSAIIGILGILCFFGMVSAFSALALAISG